MDDNTIEFNGELWVRKGIDHYLSGHIYAHSAMETAYDCGNCDGGKCRNCTDVYQVFVMRLPENEHEKEICNRIRRPLIDWKRFEDRKQAEEYFQTL